LRKILGYRIAALSKRWNSSRFFTISASIGRLSSVITWLGDYTENTAPNLSFVSRDMLKKEFEGLQNMYLGVGGAIAFVLALIGILNFVNAMAASIHARRRELAMLQSVGMTGRQLKQMLMFEGAWYTALTAAFTLTIGFAATYLITELIAGGTWVFLRSITLLPSALCLPFLLALCAVVPVICYAKLNRESILTRLRVE
jgi:putative ABC transport system permease protein